MKKEKIIKNGQRAGKLNGQLDDLLAEAKKVNKETDEINKQLGGDIDDLSAKIDDSIDDIEQIYSDLDEMEIEAGDEIDKLILEEAENLAGEE